MLLVWLFYKLFLHFHPWFVLQEKLLLSWLFHKLSLCNLLRRVRQGRPQKLGSLAHQIKVDGWPYVVQAVALTPVKRRVVQ